VDRTKVAQGVGNLGLLVADAPRLPAREKS